VYFFSLFLPRSWSHDGEKTVDGTTVINPSFLSKGTYATMELGATTGSAPMVEISKIDLGSGTKAE
jgi:hypothetical protein